MLSNIANSLPEDVSAELKNAMASVAEAFAQACMDDPAFEIGMLTLSFMPPDSTWRSGEPWGARHWAAKQRVVRSADVPVGLPMSQFARSRQPSAEWNAAFWLVGLKPDGSGLVVRTYTEAVPDPLQPLEDGNFAMDLISSFAGSL